MAVVVAPAFVVGDDFEAGNKPRKLAVVEQKIRPGLAVPLEVAARGVRDDEDAAGREQRRIERKERAVEVVKLEDQVPRSHGRRVALEIEIEIEIERDGFEAISRADRLVVGEREADRRDVGEGHVEPAPGQREGVAPCSAADSLFEPACAQLDCAATRSSATSSSTLTISSTSPLACLDVLDGLFEPEAAALKAELLAARDMGAFKAQALHVRQKYPGLSSWMAEIEARQSSFAWARGNRRGVQRA